MNEEGKVGKLDAGTILSDGMFVAREVLLIL